MLIAHEAFYSLDNRAHRLGFLYNRRLATDGSDEDKIRQAWESARFGAERLQADLGGAVEFDESAVEVFINDRMLAPNTQETFDALAPALRNIFGEGATFTRDKDPRGLFRVLVNR
jgi:hypothetical protein